MTSESRKIFSRLLDVHYQLKHNSSLCALEIDDLTIEYNSLLTLFKKSLGGDEQYEIFIDNGRKMFAS